MSPVRDGDLELGDWNRRKRIDFFFFCPDLKSNVKRREEEERRKSAGLSRGHPHVGLVLIVGFQIPFFLEESMQIKHKPEAAKVGARKVAGLS